MKKILLSLALFLYTALANGAIPITPRPLSVEQQKGTLHVKPTTEIVASTDLQPIAQLFAQQVSVSLGYELKVVASTKKAAIQLKLDNALETEAYQIEINKRSATITGGSAQGLFYGLQTLRQLISAYGSQLPGVKITDKPCLAYRGMMLDVCRHFFTVDEVKRFIDIMAMHKLNRLHWHLADDQGWRIEIKQYPRLTEVGSIRKETLVNHLKDPNPQYDGKPYGGYYTQEQVKEVINYAATRFVEVIPEIEMPGHGMGALTSYPWLGCTKGPYEVWTKWGISKDIYCAGRESTFDFIKNVLSEIIALFPSKYLHIGGDESPKDRWKVCPDCQKRIRDEKLKDENELQNYFVQRIEKWLDKQHRTVIGWDEIYNDNMPTSIVIMPWRDQKYGIAAAQHGNKVIMTPKWNCYFDYSQTSDPARYEPLVPTRYLSIRQVYRLDPFDQLTPAQQKNILGVQANLWTEYIPTFERVEEQILPRMAALAEVGWACDRKDYNDFADRLPAMRKLYEACGYHYAPYVFQGIE